MLPLKTILAISEHVFTFKKNLTRRQHVTDIKNSRKLFFIQPNQATEGMLTNWTHSRFGSTTKNKTRRKRKQEDCTRQQL
jgi:hypothetical protein